jgi:hypothetical protein
LQHQNKNENDWVMWKIKNEMIEQKMEYLQKYLEDFDNRIIQTLVSVGDICAYHWKTKWHRAKVLHKR